jgi:tellurite resistance protein
MSDGMHPDQERQSDASASAGGVPSSTPAPGSAPPVDVASPPTTAQPGVASGTPPAAAPPAGESAADESAAKPDGRTSGLRRGRKLTRPAPRAKIAQAGEPALAADLQAVDEPASPQPLPMVGRLALNNVLQELHAALGECRVLYLSRVPRHEDALQDLSRRQAISLDRLHRCLLVKICGTIAEADGRWAYEEQRCAAAVLEHVGIRCTPEQLQATALYVRKQAAQLEWPALVQPFLDVSEGDDQRAELATVVARIANLIAKADGLVSAPETIALRQIQEAVRLDRREAPEPLSAETVSRLGSLEQLWGRDDEERTAAQVRGDAASLYQQSLARLDQLVGLRRVKQETRNLADRIVLQVERRRAGLPFDLPPLQLLFAGPPGTGKITVARILSDLLCSAGLLRHRRLVEIHPVRDVAPRSAWEAEQGPDGRLREPTYAQSRSTREAEEGLGIKIAQAVGGTLLVDQASLLLAAEEPPYPAARRLLLQTLAKYRGQMAVICADQPEALERLFQTHPEVPGTFSHHLQFPECNASQLGQIFQWFCNRQQYRTTRRAQIKLLLGFRWRLDRDGARCGNGHLARQVFEEAVHRLAHRIAGVPALSKQLLTTFEEDDILVPGVPAQVWSDLADPDRRFVVACPGCGSENLVGPQFLGIRVECRRCHHTFVCAWGEPCTGQTPALA